MSTHRRPDAGEAPRRIIALVAAAGRGTRLGADLPKAFVRLRGRTLVERSVCAMVTSGIVDEVIVLVSADMEDYARQVLDAAGLGDAEIPVRLVRGGGERADSVWQGLKAIPDAEAVVLIHDAARALTPPGLIARVARTVLAGERAVIPVVPVADTIKLVREAPPSAVSKLLVDTTPDRAGLRAVQTPQGFDLATLRAANEAYLHGGGTRIETRFGTRFVPTDDASLVEWFGVPVACVDGDPMALKITTSVDLTLARAIVDEAEPTIFEVPEVIED